MIDSDAISEIRWCDTTTCIPDALTKSGSKNTANMLKICQTGEVPNLKQGTNKRDEREMTE